MANLIPGAYRSVAVSDVDVPLDAASLRAHFLGREAYRRTRWIVARREPAGSGGMSQPAGSGGMSQPAGSGGMSQPAGSGGTSQPAGSGGTSQPGGAALLRVDRTEPEPLFAPITEVEVLAGPDECCVLDRPDLDTAIPAHLARAADDPAAAGARAVIVHGRYGHISFIFEPRPVRITVLEVVPPYPAKLLAQAQAVLDVAEDLPPTVLEAEALRLDDVVPDHGAVLLPCRGADITLPGRETRFLDQRPPFAEWTLLGCDRSREIHSWFYGQEPAASIDLCPRRLPVAAAGPVLTKCCLLEQQIQLEPGRAVVPWGASLSQVGEAVAALARKAEPAWAPA